MVNKHGGKRQNAGRKTKVDEHKLIEKLSPLENTAYKALEDGLNLGEPWSVKMFFEYMYGKPKQQIEETSVRFDNIMTDQEKQDFKNNFLKEY